MRTVVFAVLLMISGVAGAQESARPWMGVLLGPIEKQPGARVEQILPDTPAAKAGLKVGDLIATLDGAAVVGSAELIAAIQERGVGQKVALGVTRDGKPCTIRLALEARPDELELMRSRLVGKPVPKFELAAAAGGKGPALTSDGLKGKVVVLELWATWCGPCRASMPRVDAWEKKLGKKGLAVVAISEEPAESVARFHAKEKIGHALYRADGIAGKLYSTVVPTWVVVDRAGIVRYVDVGAGSKLDGIEKQVALLLK